MQWIASIFQRSPKFRCEQLKNVPMLLRTVSSSQRPIYFDNQATTPLDPRVLDKMMPYFVDRYGNPHSRSHAYGWEAEESIEEARTHVANLIQAESKNIIFTSGATESNNLAIKGVAQFYGPKPSALAKGQTSQDSLRPHLITTQLEHKCVLQSCRQLQLQGWDVTYLPVETDGTLNLQVLEEMIRPKQTKLCSIMHVNNEIGVIQDIESIGKICRKHKIFFHTDAAQSVGKLPIHVNDMAVDLLSISGHKLYGPKGVGALFVNHKPRVRLTPIIDGGGQERGFRSGTLPTPLIVGLGEACRIAMEERLADQRHVEKLGQHLLDQLTQRLPNITLNGSKLSRYAGNINLSFAFVEGESLIMSLDNIAISSGSACTSASLEPSYVLRALGVNEDLAHTSLRFGIGRFTTEEEVNYCVENVVREVQRLREMSPLYEVAMEELKTGKKPNISWT